VRGKKGSKRGGTLLRNVLAALAKKDCKGDAGGKKREGSRVTRAGGWDKIQGGGATRITS